MPFVKLDCGIVNSTLWANRDSREIFITALLMARPYEFETPQEQIEVKNLAMTGFKAPPGWYGFVESAGAGIIRQAGLDPAAGFDALEVLGNPDPGSRTPDHEGRRMIRIAGGYLILNYMNYRDKDYTAAERMRRLRQRKRLGNASSVTRNVDGVTRKSDVADKQIQIADSNADENKDRFAEFWEAYPKKVSRAQAEKTWKKKNLNSLASRLIQDVTFRRAHDAAWQDKTYIPNPGTYLNQERWNDEVQQYAPAKRNLSAVERVANATRAREAERENDKRTLAQDD